MTYKLHDRVTLKPGYGYWDVTNYPRGGCFRRASRTEPVFASVTDPEIRQQEIGVTLETGERAVVQVNSLMPCPHDDDGPSDHFDCDDGYTVA